MTEDLFVANRVFSRHNYRWWKEFGGLKLDQARRLKELEKENSRLKRLVAELSLKKQLLRDVAQGNFQAWSGGVER